MATKRTDLPTPIPYVSLAETAPLNDKTVGELPKEINLDVPFSSQAPLMIWDKIHKDLCEEAAVLMVDAYYKKRTLLSEGADKELLRMVDWEKNEFGYFEDTDAKETAKMAKDFYGYKRVEIISNVTEQTMRQILAAGNPIILPTYGRGLKNPYYSGLGPIYHMLVLRGYTKDGKFITNDPGTKRGENYVYDSKILLNAIADLNGGDVQNGKKVMIVVYPN